MRSAQTKAEACIVLRLWMASLLSDRIGMRSQLCHTVRASTATQVMARRIGHVKLEIVITN